MNETAAWLIERLPPDSGAPALVHNDTKLDNVMLDPRDPARVVAVLDWEMCTVGDPLIDLGLLLCYWPQADDPEVFAGSLRSVTMAPGWMKRAEIVERYAARSGRRPLGHRLLLHIRNLQTGGGDPTDLLPLPRGTDARRALRDFDKRVEALAKWARSMAQKKF